MKKIQLNGKYKEHFSLVDDEDFDLVKNSFWHGQSRGGAHMIYAVDGHRKLMHKIIMGNKDGLVLDHINGNGLDNRRENLRFCTPKQNSRNSKKSKKKRYSSKYKGVWKKTYKSGKSSWVSAIMVNRKKKYLGTYATQEEAAYAYNLAAKKYFKEYANLNKLPQKRYVLPSKEERRQISLNNINPKQHQKLITFRNKTLNYTQWARKLKCSDSNISRKARMGLPVSEILAKKKR